MKTVKQVFDDYKIALADVYETQEIDGMTTLVLSDLLNKTKAQLKAFPDTEIDATQKEKLITILQQLKTGRPVQYILGYTDFYGLTFNVSPAVLIPRPETEELVQWIIQTVTNSAATISHILDIGTGSGCIAIALKKHLPHIQIFAMDISAGALEVAKANAVLNEVDVTFIEADILNSDNKTELPQFDIIVSNPPYVTQADKLQMHKNVVDFEPHTALFVPENDPLLFYNAIAAFARERLADHGQLFFEINESLGNKTVELLCGLAFKNIELRQDMPGRDRMIRAIK